MGDQKMGTRDTFTRKADGSLSHFGEMRGRRPVGEDDGRDLPEVGALGRARAPRLLKYRERRPAAALRPYVECVWTISGPRVSARRAPERVVPDGCPELIVHLGDPFARWIARTLGRAAARVPRRDAHRGRGCCAPGGAVDTIGIRFRAGETTGILPLSMAGASDREMPLAGIVGRAAAQRAGAGACGAPERATAGSAAAERWLAARLAEAPPRRERARRAPST